MKKKIKKCTCWRKPNGKHNKACPMVEKKIKKMKAWADVGSHGGIFEFGAGPVANRYPHLLHVFSEQVTPDLVPVLITPLPRRKPLARLSEKR